MSPDKQRLAIAEACGWQAPFQLGWLRDFGPWPGLLCPFCGTDPSGDRSPVPDFCADLNAMHEAEETLQESQLFTYSNELYDLAVEHQLKTGKWRYLSMTAAQRAEAFLRTIGKWEAKP